MEAHQLINQNSGKVEWYTPMDIIGAARELYGGAIDLDPATSEKANLRIIAKRGYMEPGYQEVPIDPLTEGRIAGLITAAKIIEGKL